MHTLWVALGIIVLGAGLVDLFLTALNYDEAGFLATPLCAFQWRCVRSITRRLSRRWRPMLLRQITGLQVVLSAVVWLACVVVGFGLIYYGLMYGKNFQYDGPGIHSSLFSAMYLSLAQLSTVGTSQISPTTDPLRILTVIETLSTALLVTMILTFLLGVYQVVHDLRTLSANFITPDATAGDPVASLQAYFPEGHPLDLDSHLQAISDSFWSYADGLRQHHIAYYFQSGRDQFSFPYVLHMLGGSLSALRWGLPTGHPATLDPLLARLGSQFDQVTNYLHDQLRWKSTAVPEIAPFESFAAALGDSTMATADTWIGRFLRMSREMARMARIDGPIDPQDAYQRYRQWLPFAYRAQQLAAAVGRDLDYEPIFRGNQHVGGAVDWGPDARARGSRVGAATWPKRLCTLLNRWIAVPDPGLTRLLLGARAAFAAAASAGTVFLLCTVVGVTALPPAMFGGMVGMYAAMMPGAATTRGRWAMTGLITLSAVVGAAIGAAAAPLLAAGIAALVVVVLVGVWVGGFGPRAAAVGQMAFMAYYFGLLLHLRIAMVPEFAVAAAIGALWAYLFHFALIADHPDRVLRGGLSAFQARLIMVFDPLIDAVSASRWDPDIDRQTRACMRQVHRCAAFLQGQLHAINPDATGSLAPSGTLRLRLFDTELAVNAVVATARRTAGAGTEIAIPVRAQLAGILESAQAQLQRDAKTTAPAASHRHNDPEVASSRAAWPKAAERLHEAVDELLRAAGMMWMAQATNLSDPDRAAGEVAGATGAPVPPPEPSVASAQAQRKARVQNYGLQAPTTRRAIQAAIATGLALLIGPMFTTTHQYWAVLAAFLVLGGTGTVEETTLKGFARVAGTIVGAIIGFAVAERVGANPAVILPLVAVCAFAGMYVRPVSYAQTVFWMTIMLALLYDFLGELTTEALEARVAETLIGAVLALGAAALILPTRARQRTAADGVAFLETIDGIVQACLDRLVRAPESESLAAQTLLLDQQSRQLTENMAPLRRVTGALGRGGVERRLTAVAALTYQIRQLVKDTDAFVAGNTSAAKAQCTQLGVFTRDNITALAQVLMGHPPGTVHGSEELPSPTEGGARFRGAERGTVLRDLAHINETVLTILADLTHDNTEQTAPAARASGTI